MVCCFQKGLGIEEKGLWTGKERNPGLSLREVREKTMEGNAGIEGVYPRDRGVWWATVYGIT